ncbi:MAG TPA: M23 family metallopeptidase [Longimicrobiales bacterium]|nr:M23 family metallopeptidase [Longimicrobiales bacterium]
MHRIRPPVAALLLAGTLASACERVEQVQDHFRDRTPHEAYLASLADAGLAGTALVRDWIAVSLRAVEGAPLVQLPFQEEGFIAPDEAVAMAYRLRIGRGQRLSGEVTLGTDANATVFVDLFRVPEEPADPLRPVLSVDTVPGEFRYEPWREGEYILRVQPELLRGGRYRVVLRLEAQLAFPVDGHGESDIHSGFGSARDGGRRSHHGVDIFAPRGTPVLAAAEGVVSRVQVTNLGGKVVWVRDAARNANLYFAHLDSQAVLPNEEVAIGDTLGFVGNTGNARSTPPHLHFGLYRRGEGPVDPAPFLRRPRGVLERVSADLERLGRWVQPTEEDVPVRSAPSQTSELIAEVAPHASLRVWGGSGAWYRVRLADGRDGYVSARLTEPAERPPETRSTAGVGLVALASEDPASQR